MSQDSPCTAARMEALFTEVNGSENTRFNSDSVFLRSEFVHALIELASRKFVREGLSESLAESLHYLIEHHVKPNPRYVRRTLLGWDGPVAAFSPLILRRKLVCDAGRHGTRTSTRSCGSGCTPDPWWRFSRTTNRCSRPSSTSSGGSIAAWYEQAPDCFA